MPKFKVVWEVSKSAIVEAKDKEEAIERAREAIEVTLEGFTALGKQLEVKKVEVTLEKIEVAA